MKISWADALEAMYGTQVSGNQIKVWEHYLKAEGTNSEELAEAIEMAANEGIKGEEWRVTVRDLRKWLKTYRTRQRTEVNSEQSKERLKHFISEWKEKLARGAKQDDFLYAVYKLNYGIVERNNICNDVLG